MADTYSVSPTVSGGDDQEAQHAGYNPSEAEQAALRLQNKLFDDAKKVREKYDAKWLENYRMFRGKQWPSRRPSYRHSEVLNFIASEVYTLLTLLTDNRPNIEALPEDPSDTDFAEIISKILTAKWDQNNWATVLAESIVDASCYGSAVGYVPWKPELLDGLGDFAFETLDPLWVYPDPSARSKINDEYCYNVTTAIPEDVARVRARHPDQKDFIQADVEEISAAGTFKEDLDEMRLKSALDNRVTVESGRGGQTGAPNQVLVVRSYLKDDTRVENVVGSNVDPLTGLSSDLYQTQKKFPNGRCIESANGVLLKDDGNPYDDGLFPYAVLIDNPLPRQLWGAPDIEFLSSPQRMLNKLISYMLDVLELMGNPIYIVDSNSGVDTDNLTNEPGLVVEKTPGSEVRRESGVQLQPFVMSAFEMLIERVWPKLASTNETSRGIAPSSNSSGFAIEQLQEAAQTRIRGKARYVEAYLKDIGGLMVSRIMQFYTIPRVVRLTNNDGAAQYFKFHISEVQDEQGETQKIANYQEYAPDPTTGQLAPGITQQIPVKSKLDLRISTGTQLPFAKAQKSALAEKLYDKGIIDAEEYLTQLDYPNRDKIIARMRENAAAQGGMNGQPNGAPSGPAGAASPSPAVNVA